MADGTYPVKVIARVLMLDVRRVQQLAKEGVVPREGRGRYDLVKSVQGYIGYLQERARVSPQDEGRASDYTEGRTRRELANAELAELEVAEKRGELLRRDEVIRTWTTQLVAVKERLRAIPSKLRGRLKKLTKRQLKVIAEEIDRGLRELAGDGLPPATDGGDSGD